MNKHSKTLTLVCLIGLSASIILAGVVLAVERRVRLWTFDTVYTPLSGKAEWEGGWEFSELGADPSEMGSQTGADRVTISFVGANLALRVRRGNYRGNFFVSIDGEPANRLPREQGGQERGAYLVLTSPDYASQVADIPVATGLDDGPHTAIVVADRGWGQWPLVGWSTSRAPGTSVYRWAAAGLVVLGLGCLTGLAWGIKRAKRQGDKETRGQGGQGARGQGEGAVAGSPQFAIRNSARPQRSVFAILIAAAVFYFSPWFPLTLAGGLALAVLIFLRLDLGLALVAATAPFYMHPRSLFGRSFSMAEILTLLCALSWGIKQIGLFGISRGQGIGLPNLLGPWRKDPQQVGESDTSTTRNPRDPQIGKMQERPHPASCTLHPVSSLDLAVLLFVLASIGSTVAAEYRHVALRELRVVVLEPALFYLMLRTSRLDGKAVWRVLDFFVLGGVVVALIGLVQFGLGVNVITAEQGFRRLRSVYGSPNNAGLYLGRVLPVVMAVGLFGAARRRVIYGLAAVPVGLAVLCSFSRGALILGVPLSLLALGLLAGGPWLRVSLGALAAGVVAAVPLLRTPRFASLFDTSRGATFFRLQLWRSSWAMFRDHLWFGVGPDNFLYQYRSRYILPAAWQEPDLSHPHDVLLDYGCRLGLIGLAAGLWLQIAFWRLALPLRRLLDHDRRALALGLMASMVNFMAHGLVDASYFVIDLAFAFFLALGVVQWLAVVGREGYHS